MPKSFKNKIGQDKRKTCHKDPLCFGTETNMKTKFLWGLNFFCLALGKLTCKLSYSRKKKPFWKLFKVSPWLHLKQGAAGQNTTRKRWEKRENIDALWRQQNLGSVNFPPALPKMVRLSHFEIPVTRPSLRLKELYHWQLLFEEAHFLRGDCVTAGINYRRPNSLKRGKKGHNGKGTHLVTVLTSMLLSIWKSKSLKSI